MVPMRYRHHTPLVISVCAFAAAFCWVWLTSDVLRAAPTASLPAAEQTATPARTSEQVARSSVGCITCHVLSAPDAASMHKSPILAGCVDCHGGDATAMRSPAIAVGSGEFDKIKRKAHVQPRLDIWKTSANPAGQWYRSNEESAEFIQFVNPGDLRVVDQTCGTSSCHPRETLAGKKSMMRHGGMLWGAALYNNGSFPSKTTQFGEFYMPDGTPAIGYTTPAPTKGQMDNLGVIAALQPLFPFQVTQPGNILRVFERGGAKPLEPGNPNPEELPGRPNSHLSDRGLGTLNRTDPVFIGLQKTRLFDPTLNFMGSNDGPGDFRASGCTACHVVYANDRSPVHSAGYAKAGNLGRSMSTDPMIPKTESGHPIAHVMTTAIPTSQCMVCHMHPGTNMVASYLGMTWWDNETDGAKLYPATTPKLSEGQRAEIQRRNPEGSALRGLWSDPAFLARTGSPEFNSTLSQTQLADFHGHGWLFRAVFKRDRRGNLVDAQGNAVKDASSAALGEAVGYVDLRNADSRPSATARSMERAGKPVHLKDIHLERGMQCVDCHFGQDSHGNGALYGEPRAAIAIQCIDCHGSARARSTLRLSGPAAAEGDRGDMRKLLLPDKTPRFDTETPGKIIQYSVTQNDVAWVIPQVVDSITPGNAAYNPRAALAKTIQKDGKTWGSGGAATLAHANESVTCQTCHSSWVTSCFGCHLSQTANQKRDVLHNEKSTTRNWTSYNFQVLRDDVYMLGKDGPLSGGRVSPVRSSSAVVVSSQDVNRQDIYAQQQTVSAEGYSGQAFNTHVPHTVRTTETKSCTDCHVSSKGDNNAIMSQLLLLGTNFTNFMGRFIYVATGKGGVDAVAVTEKSEPQAVLGSELHRLAYPKEFAEHERRGQRLTTAVHVGSENALSVQARGEYLYVADGSGGFRAFDIAQINQKGFSEKIVTAPVSPIGQRTRVQTRFASAVVAPSTLAVDPARSRNPDNLEQPIHALYAYIYIADREEGLVLSTAATLLDGNPSNNFLKRAATFNPEGRLRGASQLAIAGVHAYVLCDRGLVVVDLSTPLTPKIVGEVSAPAISRGTSIAIQFRYAFVTDAGGFKVVDITTPERPRLVPTGSLAIPDARSVYVARTYAYVAAGAQGIAIVDVEQPERPKIDQMFNAGGSVNDANDIKIAMTNASVFGYVADGRNGLRVVQMMSANSTPGVFGFSPRPTPKLIATYKTSGPALSISKGLDRDRAVDESGNQVAVFGRKGSRPFNLTEMQRMYLRNGELWTVTDAPPGPPTAGRTTPSLMDRLLRPIASHTPRGQR